MPTITIRHSTHQDIEDIRYIYSEEAAVAGTLQIPFPSQKSWIAKLEASPPGFYSLVAEMDDHVVGQLGLHNFQRPRRKHVATLGLAVKDAYRSRGAGTKLVSAAIDLAENWLNVERIELTVFTDAKAATKLYKKFGFTIEGESAKYAYRNGEYVSAYHMARVR